METKTVIIILSLLLNISCFSWHSKNESCGDFKRSFPITKDLFIEEYYTFKAGVFGEMVTVYLTDSINFKVLIANKDEHMRYNIYYDSIKRIVNIYGLEEQSLVDSLIDSDTINIYSLVSIHQMDTAFKNAIPLFGDNYICKNSNLVASYSMDKTVYPVPEGYYLIIDQYKCEDEFLESLYITDNVNFKFLIQIAQTNKLLKYSFVNQNDSILIVYSKKTRTIYDTLYQKSFLIDSLIKSKTFTNCNQN